MLPLLENRKFKNKQNGTIGFLFDACMAFISLSHLFTICGWLGPFQVRVTNLHDAAEHIEEVLKRVKEHLERAYKIKDWWATSALGFMIALLYVSPAFWT